MPCCIGERGKLSICRVRLITSLIENGRMVPHRFGATGPWRNFRSRQDRHVPAPDRYTRLASDTTGLCPRFANLTSSCQFDALRTLAEIVMHGESILAVCHQWLGTNRSSPGSRTKVVGTALAKRGNLSK